MSDGVSLGFYRCDRQTEKAIRVRNEGGDERWVPKAVVHDDSEVWKVPQWGDLIVATWWAEKEGLV